MVRVDRKLPKQLNYINNEKKKSFDVRFIRKTTNLVLMLHHVYRWQPNSFSIKRVIEYIFLYTHRVLKMMQEKLSYS